MIDLKDLDERVLEWLSPHERDPALVSQSDAQQLAWYTAPEKWIVAEDELPEVAAACARLLEKSGRHRAAAALTEHTPAVLAGWAHSPQFGFSAYLKAMQATGVKPPDTPTLSWGQVMGPEENMVLHAAEQMLEAAIDSGAFTPGGRAWRTTQQSLVESWLRTPSTLFAGRAPLDVIHAERRAWWADSGTPARRAILRPLLPRLAAPKTDSPVDTIPPLRFLLHALGSGVTLTSTGRLPPALVRDAAAQFGWGLPGFKIRNESDVIEVCELRDLATRTRLIAVRRRQLALTEAGQAALDDPAQLWKAATAGWFDYDLFAAHVAEIAGAILLDGPATAETLITAVHQAVAPSFRDPTGAHPDEHEVRTALWEWLRPGNALGWLPHPPGIGNYQLTELGHAAALEGLRHRSQAPRTCP